MKKSLILFFAAALVLSLAMSIAADIPRDYYVSPYPVGTMGDTFLTCQMNDPRTFNTHIAKETSSTDIIYRFLYSATTRDPHTAEIIPQIVKGWDFSDDGLVWDFYLREGATWSDGVPITAYDFEFNMDVIYDETVPTSSRDILQVGGEYLDYEVVDEYTFRIIVPEPFAPLLASIPGPLPKHILYEPWKAGDFNETWGVNTPPSEIVGNGTFILGGYRPGERVVLLRNPNFWQVDQEGNPLPYMTRWIMHIVESQEAMMLKFEAGETHQVSVLPDAYARYKMNERRWNMTVHDLGPAFSTMFVVFNQNPNAPQFDHGDGEDYHKFEWFTNIHFRRAVAHSLDKDTLIDVVYDGLATPQWSPVSAPNEFFLNPDVPKYPYDLEQAREELRKGGFDWDAQGNLVDWEGRRVEFLMTTNAGNAPREALGNILQSDLQELGMRVTFSPMDFNLMVGQLLSTFDWECIIIGLTGGLEPHGGRNTWHSSGHLHMWHPYQTEPATEWEARVDEIFDEGAMTMDPDERQELYYEWQEIIATELPLIYTVTQHVIVAFRNTVKNVDPTIISQYHNVGSFHIER